MYGNNDDGNNNGDADGDDDSEFMGNDDVVLLLHGYVCCAFSRSPHLPFSLGTDSQFMLHIDLTLTDTIWCVSQLCCHVYSHTRSHQTLELATK